jgi:hypothetical protein
LAKSQHQQSKLYLPWHYGQNDSNNKAALRISDNAEGHSIFVGKNASNSSQSCIYFGTFGSLTAIIMLP